MALSNTVTIAHVKAQCPELGSASNDANIQQDINNAYDWLKAELALKYGERLVREEGEEFSPAKVPNAKNALYMRVVISRARFFAYRRIETNADSGSHAWQRDFYYNESEDLIRRTPLYYDVDESGDVESDELIDTGTEAVR